MDINSYRDTINELLALEREIRRVKTMHALNGIQTNEAKEKIRQLEQELRKKAEMLPEGKRELFLYRRESEYYGYGG